MTSEKDSQATSQSGISDLEAGARPMLVTLLVMVLATVGGFIEQIRRWFR